MDLAKAERAWTGCALRILVTALPLFVCGSLSAEEPLRQRIDQSMAEIHPGPEIPLCGDGEFLRRVYLDLLGRIPTGTEARSFLADTDDEKRDRVVQSLLDDPAHAEHMAKVFDVMLMERRPNKHVKGESWDSFLLTSFRQHKPLNQIAYEILDADGVDEQHRGPAKFYLEREGEPNLLTREVGRMFFGMDLQCAQCHDHPSIDDYYQSDYYGLYAFVGRSYLFQPDTKKPAVLAEKAEGDAKFKSVFTDEEGSTLPRLPGSIEIDEPSFAKDDAYEVKPDPKKKEIRPVPKFSRRHQLAVRATDGSNAAFNRNLANRIWAHMMGRGLVHPVDQHHTANPPIQPRLLEMLADDLQATNFDLRSMLGELALSRTYQRTIDLPSDIRPYGQAAKQQLEIWNERLAAIESSVEHWQNSVDALHEQLKTTAAELQVQVDAEKEAAKALAEAVAKADEAAKKLDESRQALTKQQSVFDLVSQSVDQAARAAELVDDQPLDQAIRLLEARRNEYQSQVNESTKSVAKLNETSELAADKRNEAQKASEATRNQRIATSNDADRIAIERADAQEQLRFEETQLTSAENHIARLELTVEYADLVSNRDSLRQEIQQSSEQIEGLQKTLALQTSEVDRLSTEQRAAESALAMAKTAASTVKQQRDSILSASKLIATSSDKAAEAAGLIPEDADFKTLVDDLRSASKRIADRVDSQDKLLADSDAKTTELAAKLQTLKQQHDSTTVARNDAASALDSVRKQEQQLRQRLESVDETMDAKRIELASTWSRQFSIAVLQPLTPEQLANSILHATGQLERQRTSIKAAYEKKNPLKPEDEKDAEKLASRKAEIDRQVDAAIDKIVGRFVTLFAAAGGQPQDDFFATVDQALFFRNGGELRGWLQPAAGNLTDRLQKIEDPKSLAEEMYLSILTRLPTDDETADVTGFLNTPDLKKSDAIVDLTWALFTSAEFRFQH